ncbi:putative F-box domain-containing protein [Tanacetum coccineum]|uniref:F-box domain-containing protein n=1 Tax=Tanacetum coccineum TaxID=301880 RepID=A0ABQ5I6J2_9ASTR
MVMIDVVEEVLLRLTIKDLLQCKSVCKSWYSLISSPSFVKLHLKFICKKEDKNNKQLGNKRIAMLDRCVISNGVHYILDIEGSSNVLVCISSLCDNRLFLTNPSTREFRILHKPPILLNKFKRYGFGYDSSTNDYKIVMAINKGFKDGTLVQILSLKSNIWNFDANYTRDRKALIVSFNLAKKEFIEIPQPDDTKYDWSYGSIFGIIEDRLCIFETGYNDRPKGIWVMKNYNVKPSWELLPDDYGMKDNVNIEESNEFLKDEELGEQKRKG